MPAAQQIITLSQLLSQSSAGQAGPAQVPGAVPPAPATGAVPPAQAPAVPPAPAPGMAPAPAQGIVPLSQLLNPPAQQQTAPRQPNVPRLVATQQPGQPGQPGQPRQITIRPQMPSLTLAQQAQQGNAFLQSGGRFLDSLSPGATKDIGGTGFNLQDLTGPLNLASGISSGNPLAAASGGLQTLGSALRIGDMPKTAALVRALGGPMNIAGGVMQDNPFQLATGAAQTLSSLANLAGFPKVGGAIGTLAGPITLASGIQSGDAASIASGVIGSYGALATLSQLAKGAGLISSALPSMGSLIGSGISSAAPLGTSAIGGIGAGAGFGAVGAALSFLGQQGDMKGLKEVGDVISQLTPLVTALTFNPVTGAVAAAIQVAMSIAQGIQAGNPPWQIVLDALASPDVIATKIMQEVIDPMFHPSEDWMSFPGRVQQTAALSAQSLHALASGLPYVQNKQELAGLVGAYRGAVANRVGGFAESGTGPLDIGGLPEVGERTHGFKTKPTDFGAITSQMQPFINQYHKLLPDAPAGANAYSRTFGQFFGDRRHAPIQYAQSTYGHVNQYTGQYESDLPLRYGDPGYDYVAAGYPLPGNFFGEINPLWAQLGMPAPPARTHQSGLVAAPPMPLSPEYQAESVAPGQSALYVALSNQGLAPEQIAYELEQHRISAP